VPHIVDPGPWRRQRIAEETAPLRAELAAATSLAERLRLRRRILAVEARLWWQFNGGAGPTKF
jgi:hypothetical protein